MSDLSLPQDLNERFDVVNSDGTPTGRTKARGEVHRDGDWHRAVHVWVVGIDEQGPYLTFQRRSLTKDTQPGRLDATVGGHYRAGESVDETLREIEEEIGISVTRAELRYAGMRICVHDTEIGIHDHELQDVFFLRDDRPLTAFRPSPAELAGLVRVRISDLLAFLAGDVYAISAKSVATGSAVIQPITMTQHDLIQRPDQYLYRVAISAERFLAGERHIAV
jgi:isopentenyldiphosphate isomerase